MERKYRATSPEELQPFIDDEAPVWIFDFHNSRMLWANDAALAFWDAPTLRDFVDRDYSSDSNAVRERLWQTIDAIPPGEWARDSWTVFPQDRPVTVLVDARLITFEDIDEAILFRLVRKLDFAEADPEGLRMMLAARATPVAVSIFDMQGQLVSENPAGLSLRKSTPEWTLSATELSGRYASQDRAREIIEAVQKDDRITFDYVIPGDHINKVLAVTIQRIRDPVTGDVVAQVTEEDITDSWTLSNELRELNAQLEQRVADRSVELEALNARLKQEIAEKKERERKLEDQLQFTQALIDSIPVPIFYKGVDGKYLGCNDLWASFLGLPKEVIIGKLVEEVLLAGDGEEPQLSDAQVLQSGQAGHFPMSLTKHNDEVRHVISYKAPFRTKDNTEGLIGTIIDITDQKQAEGELRSRELILREATTATKTGFVVYDNETRAVEYLTETVQELLGISEEHFAHLKSCIDNRFDAMGNAQGDETRRLVELAEKRGEPFDISYVVKSGAKAGHTLRVKGYPHIGADGEKTKRVSLIQDISDTVRMEEKLQQAQKMEAIGKLTGGIAHDFNNLLAVVQGNAELLDLYQDYRADLVGEIVNATKRGAELTQSLLAYARQQRLRAAPTDLSKRCIAMQKMLMRTLGEDIRLSLSYPPDLWMAYVDSGQLEDALLNLALNARDAMPDGGKLSIELENITLNEAPTSGSFDKHMAGDFVMVSVSDDGQGMPEDVRSRATDPFFTTKPAGEGSGLGLSMVCGFALQSGGNITIESQSGDGTSIKLFLPRDVSNENRSIEPHPEQQTPSGNGELIVVVEDNPSVARTIERILGRLNYRFVSFENAFLALDYLRQGGAAQVLLTDIMLPDGMRGTDLALKTRVEFPDLPVLFMSGYPSETANWKDTVGQDAVLLNKPVKLIDFAHALRDALDQGSG